MSLPNRARPDASPRLVIAEACYRYLALVADWLGNRDAAQVLKEADGIEATLPLHLLAFGNPRPRQGLVDRFHAWCDRRRIDCVRTFHGIHNSFPVTRRLRWNFTDPSYLSCNVAMVKAQTSLAAAMRRPSGGEALLVMHPGYQYRDDLETSVQSVVAALQSSAEHAAELDVRLSIENEPTSRWGRHVGCDVGVLARIVESVSEWCEARGIPPVACITLDVEHGLCAAWGRHELVHEAMERYGRLIESVHFVRPVDEFDPEGPPDPLPWHKFPNRLQRIFGDAGCPGAHGTVAPPGGDPKLEELIIAACEKTNWRRIGVFNFEAMPPWFYPTRMRTRGSRPHEILAGLRLLRRLTSGQV